MLRHTLHAMTLTAALLGVASVGTAAEDKPMPAMEHQHDITILHLVETAQTSKDHEAVAKRFDEEAAKYDKEAAHHERLAKHYRSGVGAGPKASPEALAQHCDDLVKNLKASAADLREMANLHRDVAKALAK